MERCFVSAFPVIEREELMRFFLQILPGMVQSFQKIRLGLLPLHNIALACF